MLKSTEIKLRLLDRQNQLLEERNKIERDTSEVNRQLAQQQSETRDRVDISLKEYNEMREKIKELEGIVSSQQSLLDRILKPLFRSNLSSELIDEIVVNHNYKECEVRLLPDDVMRDTSRIAVIYTVERKNY